MNDFYYAYSGRTRSLRKKINQVTVVVHAPNSVERSSPTRLSVSSCGVMLGSSAKVKKAIAGGMIGVKVKYAKPRWLLMYRRWALSLKGMGKLRLDVWDYGNSRIAAIKGRWAGIDCTIEFGPTKILMTLSGDSVGTTVEIGAYGESCLAAIKKAAKDLKSADRVISSTVKRGFFLVSDSD